MKGIQIVISKQSTLKASYAGRKFRHVVKQLGYIYLFTYLLTGHCWLQSYIQKMPVRAETGGHLAAPLAIAVCGVAVFVLVVAGIAMARRGRGAAADSLSVTEIDRFPPTLAAGNPGVPGTRPVPVNGYENPTYQYYQAAEAAAVEETAKETTDQ